MVADGQQGVFRVGTWIGNARTARRVFVSFSTTLLNAGISFQVSVRCCPGFGRRFLGCIEREPPLGRIDESEWRMMG